ncbi:hypothetical protein [Nocardioides campestrisoli]|uniref:hypothetical protein n=1 Tax=Nocardioides campestrisoli TaxID=2736757 RepID=UPI00163D8DBC|nr:hypothetical protein [Nocardioides campestrisoli]
MNALVLSLSQPVLQALESSDEPVDLLILLLGPVVAVIVYSGLYRYYRNTDKSHDFEKETRIEAQPVTARDRKVDTVRGTKRTEVKGNNVSDHRKRVQRLG